MASIKSASISILLVSILPLTLAAPQATAKVSAYNLLRRATDPCGPPGNTNNFSTCDNGNDVFSPTGRHIYDSLNLATVPPSVYGYTCLQDHSHEGLLYKSCQENADSICEAITAPNAGRDMWLWSAGPRNCTFGVWLPKTASVPSFDKCYNRILRPMAKACGDWSVGEGNVGAINLKALPSAIDGRVSTGEAVDPRYPSYVMVAQTYDNGSGPF